MNAIQSTQELVKEADALRAFNNILAYIDQDDYERADETASEIEQRWIDNNSAVRYIPCATYLKWFCTGYHTWQASYQYTAIRERFELVSWRCLSIKPKGISQRTA